MFEAVVGEEALLAPTVGTFVPVVGRGTFVGPGTVLGRLRRLGRWYDVVAPRTSRGVVSEVLTAYSAVECGSVLLRLGAATLDEHADASTARGGSEDGIAVSADVEGTLYLRPKPGEPLFAPEGTRVEQGDTLALVEVMKTFTPVRAPAAGVVGAWAVADSDPVEPGAVLVRLRVE